MTTSYALLYDKVKEISKARNINRETPIYFFQEKVIII